MPEGAPEAKSFKRFRLILWGLVVIAAFAATALYVIRPPERPVGLFGGTFSLASTEGPTFTEQSLIGAPSLVYFGYTFCPDVCPTTLAETTAWRAELGIEPENLRIIFVTVDPDRDTIDSMRSYLSGFGAPIIGLRGTEDETEAAKKAFGVFSKKVTDAASTDYLVDHTASVFLVGADGRFEGTISYGEASDAALAKIGRLIGK